MFPIQSFLVPDKNGFNASFLGTFPNRLEIVMLSYVYTFYVGNNNKSNVLKLEGKRQIRSISMTVKLNPCKI